MSGVPKLYPHVIETEKGHHREPAELGYLRVPENRRAAGSNPIELAFVRLKSTAVRPRPPVVFLAGGPGGSGIDDILRWDESFSWFLRLRESCDVIALDQRGVGLSRPRLDCPFAWELPLDQPGDHVAMLCAAADLWRRCAAFWAAQGIDLAGYNTLENCDDIDELRRALGYETISLWGASYGSNLALEMIRRYGRYIHRAVVALVEGPDHHYVLPSDIQRQMEQIHRLVLADPAMREHVPDFLGLVREILDQLRREPVVVEVEDEHSEATLSVTVGPFDLQLITAKGLGWRERIEELPARYLAMADGDFGWLAREVLERRRGWFHSAMYWHIDCSTRPSPARLKRVADEARTTLLGRAANFPFPEVCEGWARPELGHDFSAPVHSDVPTLFVSGTLDGQMPPSNAEEVLAGFPNGQHLVIDGGEHSYDDLLATSPEAAEAIRAFLTGEDVRLRRARIPVRFKPPDAL